MALSFTNPGGNEPAWNSGEKPQDNFNLFVSSPPFVAWANFISACLQGFLHACHLWILRFHVVRLDMGQVPLTWTMATDNVLWIFSACKGQWPFLIHLPVSLLSCSSQISHWLFSAGSSAYVRNFFCIWFEIRLMNSVTWKLPLKNWRSRQWSALFFRAVKGFIMHAVHGSPLKCKVFSSKDRLHVRSSLVHACVLASKCNCLDHLGNINAFNLYGVSFKSTWANFFEQIFEMRCLQSTFSQHRGTNWAMGPGGACRGSKTMGSAWRLLGLHWAGMSSIVKYFSHLVWCNPGSSAKSCRSRARVWAEP